MDLHPLFGSIKDGVITGLTTGGGGSGNPIGDEMKLLYKKNLNFDNRPAIDVIRSAAKQSGVNPALLFSSSFQEGFNKAIAKPDEVSQAYINAGKSVNGYPVDGFYNYGLDTFGSRYNDLKQYLPAGFDQQFKIYSAKNEKNQPIQTAAFKTNEAALMAKAAMIRAEMETVNAYAKKKGIALDDEDRNYFTLASYNGGFGNAQKMLDEYSTAADKKKFIKEGLTTRKGVHKNINPRLLNMTIAQSLLDEK